jgi:hypothetical protein
MPASLNVCLLERPIMSLRQPPAVPSARSLLDIGLGVWYAGKVANTGVNATCRNALQFRW